MLAQCDCSFSINFISSPGNSEINLLLCTSILACKIFLMAFFEKKSIFPHPILDSLEVLCKFLYTGKISSPVILKMWENKSGAGANPHPVWTWWSSIYTLLSETIPLNARIILLDPFSDGSSFYVACVCNNCSRTNQNRLMVSLTSPVSCLSDTFSFDCVFKFVLLELVSFKELCF